MKRNKNPTKKAADSNRPEETILVTGGSRGIGREICLRAAKVGYRVIVNYKENSVAAKAVVNTIQREGGAAIPIRADISKESGVRRLFTVIKKRRIQLTALVNNAGTPLERQKVEEISAKRLKLIFAVNFYGAFRCTQEAIKNMQAGKVSGAIVNISSISTKTGGRRNHVDYAAMKAAVETMTVGMALEYAKSRLRINAVSPGTTATDLSTDLVGPALRKVKKQIPLGRLAEPGEIAEAVIWLISPKASYVTGTVLTVAGGR